MHGFEAESFDKPDETRAFDGKGWADVINVGCRVVARGHFEPGWRWSTNVRSIEGGELCEFSHLMYCVSGRMRIHLRDGSERDITPGQVAHIPAGHDAEVIGEETCVMLDFGETADVARR